MSGFESNVIVIKNEPVSEPSADCGILTRRLGVHSLASGSIYTD